MRDDLYNSTALMTAAWRGHETMVKLLFDAHADVKARDTNGWTALIYTVISLDPQRPRVGILRMLLEHGADVSDRADSSLKGRYALRNATVLLFAVKNAGNGTETIDFLLKSGADIEARDNYGKTALMHAQRVDVVDLLLKSGADIEAKDEVGWTALMHAETVDVAELLLKSGADIEARDNEGWTALMHAKRVDVVDLLLKSGTDIEARTNDGWTALMCAVWSDRLAVAEFLLTMGADKDVKAEDGYTVLENALHKAFHYTARLLPMVRMARMLVDEGVTAHSGRLRSQFKDLKSMSFKSYSTREITQKEVLSLIRLLEPLLAKPRQQDNAAPERSTPTEQESPLSPPASPPQGQANVLGTQVRTGSFFRKLTARMRGAVDERGGKFSTDPVSTEPVSAEPVSAEPVSAEPVSAEPVSAEPVSADMTPVPMVPVSVALPPPRSVGESSEMIVANYKFSTNEVGEAAENSKDDEIDEIEDDKDAREDDEDDKYNEDNEDDNSDEAEDFDDALMEQEAPGTKVEALEEKTADEDALLEQMVAEVKAATSQGVEPPDFRTSVGER